MQTRTPKQLETLLLSLAVGHGGASLEAEKQLRKEIKTFFSMGYGKKPWYSMETAPKDCWILLVEDGKATGHKGFRYVASYWREDKREPKGGCWVDGPLTKVSKPLGWLPIPPFKKKK